MLQVSCLIWFSQAPSTLFEALLSWANHNDQSCIMLSFHGSWSRTNKSSIITISHCVIQRLNFPWHNLSEELSLNLGLAGSSPCSLPWPFFNEFLSIFTLNSWKSNIQNQISKKVCRRLGIKTNYLCFSIQNWHWKMYEVQYEIKLTLWVVKSNYFSKLLNLGRGLISRQMSRCGSRP